MKSCIFLTNKAPAQDGLSLDSVFLNAGLQDGSQCASGRSCDRATSIKDLLPTADAHFHCVLLMQPSPELTSNFSHQCNPVSAMKTPPQCCFPKHHSPQMLHFFAVLHTASSRRPSTLLSSLPKAVPACRC